MCGLGGAGLAVESLARDYLLHVLSHCAVVGVGGHTGPCQPLVW